MQRDSGYPSPATMAPQRFPHLHSYIPELDGIRGLAVWMVIAVHLRNTSPPAAVEQLPRVLRFLIGHGALGVDLFFVLSGFLITGILLKARSAPAYFTTFYARRFLRIIPLYFLMIAIMWICYRGYTQYYILSYCFLANFALLMGHGAPHGARVFWSLAVEEHFYLVWPVVVRFLDRRWLTVTGVAILLASPIARGWAEAAGVDFQKLYYYSYFRFDALALGALLAVWAQSGRATRRSSLLLAGLLFLGCAAVTLGGIPFGALSENSLLRFVQSELTFGAFVLGAFALQGSPLTSPLRWRVAKWSGDLSYCAYLIHVSVADVTDRAATALGLGEFWGLEPRGFFMARSVVVVTATFMLALLSRVLLEQPVLRLKRHFEYERPLKGAAANATTA